VNFSQLHGVKNNRSVNFGRNCRRWTETTCAAHLWALSRISCLEISLTAERMFCLDMMLAINDHEAARCWSDGKLKLMRSIGSDRR